MCHKEQTIKSTLNKGVLHMAQKKHKPMFTAVYTLNSFTLPKCCRQCANLTTTVNHVLGITIVDCKRKVFFPTRKQTCTRQAE